MGSIFGQTDIKKAFTKFTENDKEKLMDYR